MKPELQRIAIAETCGWTAITNYGEGLLKGFPPGYPTPYNCHRCDLPDYLNDLNAMHKAEEVLTLESGHWRDYEKNLRVVLIVSGRKVCNVSEEHKFMRANAAQRAEAFLRTIGKWRTH